MHRQGNIGRVSTQGCEQFTVGLCESAVAPGHDDVGSALRCQVQWSNMLLAINDSLVDSLNINKLDVTIRKVQRTVSQKGNTDKKINISVPARTLVVSLFSHSGGNGDVEIRKFQNNLLKTESFKKYVSEIVIALREPDTINGVDVIRYELNCIFKVREI